MTEPLYEKIFAIYAKSYEPRHRQRWVLSRAHIQQLLEGAQPLPDPDYDKADEFRLMGLPVRIDDVDEMRLERMP